MPVASIGFRLATLVVVYLVSFAASYSLFLPAPPSAAPPTNEPIPALVALIAVAVLNTAIVGWLILRSRWHGWRLTLCLIVAFYGIQTVLPQIESIVFPAVSRRMPEGTVAGLLVAGIVHAAIFIPIAVRLLGRGKRSPSDTSSYREPAPIREAGLRIAFAVCAYVVLYFTFGYYIAWRADAVTTYYQGVDPGSLVLQIRTVLRDTPWLIPVQAARGLLFVLVTIPIIRMMRASRAETMAATGVMMAVVMCASLLLPNPYMPFDVRMIHLAETASSNALFGVLLGWLFAAPPSRSLHDAHVA